MTFNFVPESDYLHLCSKVFIYNNKGKIPTKFTLEVAIILEKVSHNSHGNF